MIHKLADVQSVRIGEGTTVWQFSVILKGASIGNNCNVCSHTFIEDDVIIGDNVTVKNGVYIWNGIRIEDYVFIGPSVTFTNDIYPRSKHRATPVKTFIKKGASLGANTTVRCGITIGEYAMTGIASVVTKDVPAHALVFGNPARVVGWVDEDGIKMKQYSEGLWQSETGVFYKKTEIGLQKI